jgi:hypothetical protein
LLNRPQGLTGSGMWARDGFCKSRTGVSKTSEKAKSWTNHE